MRILLSTIGSRGDVQPLLALALQLKQFNQQVRICAPPDFAEWITGQGIEFTPVGPPVTQTAQGCDVLLAGMSLQFALHSIAEKIVAHAKALAASTSPMEPPAPPAA